MTTLDDLKALTWKFTAHADGSDKRGRFSINFHETTWRDGRKITGSKKQWRHGDGQSSYMVDGHSFGKLVELAQYLDQPFTAGDDKQARDD